jgi:predicted DNA-binding ribbon-helix-helix protein
MHRTNIYFAERHWKELNKQAERTGISVAELIWKILDAHPAFGRKEDKQ